MPNYMANDYKKVVNENSLKMHKLSFKVNKNDLANKKILMLPFIILIKSCRMVECFSKNPCTFPKLNDKLF